MHEVWNKDQEDLENQFGGSEDRENPIWQAALGIQRKCIIQGSKCSIIHAFCLGVASKGSGKGLRQGFRAGVESKGSEDRGNPICQAALGFQKKCTIHGSKCKY